MHRAHIFQPQAPCDQKTYFCCYVAATHAAHTITSKKQQNIPDIPRSYYDDLLPSYVFNFKYSRLPRENQPAKKNETNISKFKTFIIKTKQKGHKQQQKTT